MSRRVSSTLACISRGEASVAANLPKILGPLKAAATSGTALVGGTVYDPYLIGVAERNPKIRAIGQASLDMMTKVNEEITSADAAAGFRTADVAGAFSLHDDAEIRSAALQARVPEALAVLCGFTYMCARAPQGPNIHPKTAGYRAMASAFEQQIGGL